MTLAVFDAETPTGGTAQACVRVDGPGRYRLTIDQWDADDEEEAGVNLSWGEAVRLAQWIMRIDAECIPSHEEMAEMLDGAFGLREGSE